MRYALLFVPVTLSLSKGGMNQAALPGLFLPWFDFGSPQPEPALTRT